MCREAYIRERERGERKKTKEEEEEEEEEEARVASKRERVGESSRAEYFKMNRVAAAAAAAVAGEYIHDCTLAYIRVYAHALIHISRVYLYTHRGVTMRPRGCRYIYISRTVRRENKKTI